MTKPCDHPPAGWEIAEILASCRGRDHACTAGEIAERLRRKHRGSWNAREVRRVISHLSDKWDFLVCGVPGGGFFVPEDFDEVRTYYLFLAELEKQATSKRSRFHAHARKQGFTL